MFYLFTGKQPVSADKTADLYACTNQVGFSSESEFLTLPLSLVHANTINHHLQVRQNPDNAVWFDVGVFKALFSEVSNYYLPADGEQVTSAINSWATNTKEVKI